MIYRTDLEDGKVYQPLDWKLFSADHQRIPLDSEEALRKSLKSHPDEDFFLVPEQFMNREIQGAGPVSFDPNGEHIRCGIVRSDSASGKVVTRDRMKVTFTERAKQWGEGFALLQQATRRLEEVLGPSAPWVMALWDRTTDESGREVYTLRISDWATAKTISLTPEELRSPTNMRIILYRLWGDLLQVRSDAQHRRVEQLVSGQIQAGD